MAQQQQNANYLINIHGERTLYLSDGQILINNINANQWNKYLIVEEGLIKKFNPLLQKIEDYPAFEPGADPLKLNTTIITSKYRYYFGYSKDRLKVFILNQTYFKQQYHQRKNNLIWRNDIIYCLKLLLNYNTPICANIFEGYHFGHVWYTIEYNRKLPELTEYKDINFNYYFKTKSMNNNNNNKQRNMTHYFKKKRTKYYSRERKSKWRYYRKCN